jgi:hypothetical protein
MTCNLAIAADHAISRNQGGTLPCSSRTGTLASRSSITLSRIGSMTSIGGLRERSPCSR